MNFAQAIQSVFGQYVGFSGRARRSEYWWFFLFNLIVSAVIGGFDAAVGSSIPGVLVSLALFLPTLAVTIRRLHDINRTGWWVLIALIPIIGTIVLIVFHCTDSDRGSNRYGPSPKYGSADYGYSGYGEATAQ